MKSLQFHSIRRGSALITVVLIMAMMALLTASLLTYTMTEKRGNQRGIYQLRAKNMAENITIYAAEQLSTRFNRSKPSAAGPFTGTTALAMPASTGAAGTQNVLGTTQWTVPGSMELVAGVETPTAMAAVTDAADSNYGLYVSTVTVPILSKATVEHPGVGTFTSHVLQEMKVSMAPLFQFGMFYNMDMEFYPSRDFTVAGPVHTNGLLAAHCDGSTNINITFQDRVTSAGGLYWTTGMKASPRNSTGGENLPSEGSGHVYFTHTSGSTASMKAASGTPGANKWQDHLWGGSSETASGVALFKPRALLLWNGNVRTSAHGVTKLQLPGIGGYNETNLTSTPEDDRNNGRQLIDPPNPYKWQKTGAATVYSWEATTDDADAKETKISWKAGMFIMANPDDTIRSGTLPNGTTAYVMPGAYRVWLNTINTSTGAHTVTEVVLPGQPAYGHNAGADSANGTADDYMYMNNLPNRYTPNSSMGSNQVLRLPQMPYARVKYYTAGAWAATTAATLINGSGYDILSASGAGPSATFIADDLAVQGTDGINYTPKDGYFFDLRRANGNLGVNALSGTTALYNRYTNNYIPRVIAKIDFDMTRFKMMVERVLNHPVNVTTAAAATVYDVRSPSGGAIWNNSIFKSDGTPASYGLGMGVSFNVFPAGTDAATKNAQDPYNIYKAPTTPADAEAPYTTATFDPRTIAVTAADLYDGSAPDAWFDGIAVYINSMDAERRTQTAGIPDRIDSGVRVINGRGYAPSITDKPGFTLVTNDALYILGHFNANGTINATAGDNSNPAGYSARYPDTATEPLCALMGDAVTTLAHPIWTSATSGQVSGWNDALSALPVAASSDNWRTGGSTTSGLNGSDDGVRIPTASEGPWPGVLPTSSRPGTLGSAKTLKLDAVDTEISAALLCGIVPSNHNPTNLTDGQIPGSYMTWGSPVAKAGNGVQSGGANNFPRLLDDWGSAGLYIRGSIVALFESRVAMEPFTNSRVYRAPGRYWGLHQGLRSPSHHIPLEPILIGCNRNRYLELTPAQYATKKAAILALHP